MSESTRLLGSAARKTDYPFCPRPEVALAGRSNVGKSSLINCLAGRHQLARISGTPGKTRNIFFYLIRNEIVLVDLPGYGFARVSKGERNRWRIMIEEYLQGSENLEGIIQVLDIRHKPSPQDQEMFNWLRAAEIPFLLVATKADKIKKGKWNKHLQEIKQELDPGLGKEQLVVFSAQSGTGREKVWSFLKSLKG